jgi:hypothetical protein
MTLVISMLTNVSPPPPPCILNCKTIIPMCHVKRHYVKKIPLKIVTYVDECVILGFSEHGTLRPLGTLV